MFREIALSLNPYDAADEATLKRLASRRAGMSESSLAGYRIRHKSVDARRRDIRVNLSLEIWTDDFQPESLVPDFQWPNVTYGKEVIIVGSGPAGLFAALELILQGFRPVVLERGRDISARKRDIARIGREHRIDPDSNYCFGEGGAGTFSDGKLYTRSKKRGDNQRVLDLLCVHGADSSILYDAHPHIGTDKLPLIVESIRATILAAGGALLFQNKVTELLLNGNRICGVRVESGECYSADSVIFATGHSARDSYSMLSHLGVTLEAKTFAMGVRVEHPQLLIDRIQYHGAASADVLPAASYALVKQCSGRGVYSFCMCPGGHIVPSASNVAELVVNGMSNSRRDSAYANSGIIVEIQSEDIPEQFNKNDALAGARYQAWLENTAFLNGNSSQAAPAQRLVDYVSGRVSTDLPDVSYIPGVVSSALHEWLPVGIQSRLVEAFRAFDGNMKGFLTNDAVILGVESRSSSPVRIPRNPVTLSHPSLEGFYPAGEGSGYAGGILSSAVDGIRVARALASGQGLPRGHSFHQPGRISAF